MKCAQKVLRTACDAPGRNTRLLLPVRGHRQGSAESAGISRDANGLERPLVPAGSPAPEKNLEAGTVNALLPFKQLDVGTDFIGGGECEFHRLSVGAGRSARTKLSIWIDWLRRHLECRSFKLRTTDHYTPFECSLYGICVQRKLLTFAGGEDLGYFAFQAGGRRVRIPSGDCTSCGNRRSSVAERLNVPKSPVPRQQTLIVDDSTLPVVKTRVTSGPGGCRVRIPAAALAA